MSLTKPKNWDVRKKWTIVGLRENKNGVKSNELVTWGIRTEMQYN